MARRRTGSPRKVAQSFDRTLLKTEISPFVDRHRTIDLVVLESQVISNLEVRRRHSAVHSETLDAKQFVVSAFKHCSIHSGNILVRDLDGSSFVSDDISTGLDQGCCN